MGVGVLDRKSIMALVHGPEPLIDGIVDLDSQLQPNGFDLTLKEVSSFVSPGAMPNGAQRSSLSETAPLGFDGDGYATLAPGPYLIALNEVVHLPQDLMAFARPRSSLLRSGVAIHTAVWDAGYKGRSQALLTVYNPHGWRVARNARIMQIVFIHLAKSVDSELIYQGRFQLENLLEPEVR